MSFLGASRARAGSTPRPAARAAFCPCGAGMVAPLSFAPPARPSPASRPEPRLHPPAAGSLRARPRGGSDEASTFAWSCAVPFGFPGTWFFPALARFAREKKNITGNLSDHGTLGNMPRVNSPVNLHALKRPPSMGPCPKNTFSGAVPGRPRICKNKPASPLEHHQTHLHSKGRVARWSGGNTFPRGEKKCSFFENLAGISLAVFERARRAGRHFAPRCPR